MTRVSGTVSPNPVQQASYTLPSSATTLQNNQNLRDGSQPTVIVAPATKVVTGGTTSFRDLPGMVSFPFRAFFPSLKDLRSAASNTATAFGLDTKRSGDQAIKFEEALMAKTIAAAPPASDDSIIIPP